MKASKTYCGSVQASNTQKVIRASKQTKEMWFAVQPNG